MTIPQKRGRRQAARRRLGWAGVWLALLAVSHLVRTTPAAPSDGDARRLGFPALDGGRPTGGRVDIAFTFDCPAVPRGDPVLLLHGSPGSRHDFDGLREPLAEDRCVIAPDLPGFGDSTRRLPDYGFATHAVYMTALLDQLAIPRVHVVGFSMGGGAALTLAGAQPERLASMTLLSAIGVQELELFGDYRVNRAFHGAQLAALWALHNATPHMGLLDGTMLDVPYARNFFDSDQRPLRGILSRLAAPTLILHGRTDGLVPYEAALAHHHLVPQSELLAFDGGHFRLFEAPETLAGPLRPFLARADSGTARRGAMTAARASADAPVAGLPLRGLALAVLVVTGLLVAALAAVGAAIWRRLRG